MALERLKTRAIVAVAAGGLAALGVGGYMIASHGHAVASTKQQVRLTNAPAANVPGTTTTQATQPGADVADPAGSAAEPADTTVEAPEAPGAADGPGGYADTNATADTQQTGEN